MFLALQSQIQFADEVLVLYCKQKVKKRAIFIVLEYDDMRSRRSSDSGTTALISEAKMDGSATKPLIFIFVKAKNVPPNGQTACIAVNKIYAPV